MTQLRNRIAAFQGDPSSPWGLSGQLAILEVVYICTFTLIFLVKLEVPCLLLDTNSEWCGLYFRLLVTWPLVKAAKSLRMLCLLHYEKQGGGKFQGSCGSLKPLKTLGLEKLVLKAMKLLDFVIYRLFKILGFPEFSLLINVKAT